VISMLKGRWAFFQRSRLSFWSALMVVGPSDLAHLATPGRIMNGGEPTVARKKEKGGEKGKEGEKGEKEKHTASWSFLLRVRAMT